MIETFKKTLLAGLGAAVVTKDKVQAGMDDLVKQGKVTAADAREIAEKIAGESRREFEDASSKLGDKFRDLMSYADNKFAPKLEALEARVRALEAKTHKAASHKPHSKS